MALDEQEEKLNIHLSQMLRKIELGVLTSILLLCDGCGTYKDSPDMSRDTATNIVNLGKELSK